MPFFHPTYIIALLIAVSVHEWSHAMVATKLGDPTPHNAGRLSLNPLAHLDLLGALLFVTVGFGWAKPVPVNPAYFHRPKRDTFFVAAAGPLSNLLMAIISMIVLALLGLHMGGSAWALVQTPVAPEIWRTFLLQLFGALLFVNLGLMAFNLLPIAPLDGSKVLEAFIPRRYADQYEEFMRVGPYILLALFVGEGLVGIPLLSLWITTIISWTMQGISLLSGGLL